MLEIICPNCGHHLHGDHALQASMLLCPGLQRHRRRAATTQRFAGPKQSQRLNTRPRQGSLGPGSPTPIRFRDDAARLEDDGSLPSIRKDIPRHRRRFRRFFVVAGIRRDVGWVAPPCRGKGAHARAPNAMHQQYEKISGWQRNAYNDG